MEEENKKLEFLKKEKVRTMQKDIASLEGLKTQKEREKVPIIKPKEKPAVKKDIEEIVTMQKDIASLEELGGQKESEEREKVAVEKTKEIKKEKTEEKIEAEAEEEEKERREKLEKLLAEKRAAARAEAEKAEAEKTEAEKAAKEEEEREKEERIRIAREKARRRIAEEEEKKRQEKLLAEKRAAARAEAERAKEEEERKKIAEEEMKKRVAEEEERRRKEKKLLAERTEEEKIAEIDKKIENIGLEKERVNKEKERLLAGIKNFEIQLEPILKEEEIIENKILEIEELEKTAPLEKRSQIEKKRWETDAKRRDIEKTKWSIQEEIEKTEEKIKTIELKYQEVLREEEKFKAEKEEIFRKRQEKELTREKSFLKNEIFQLIDEKKIIENKENELLAKKNRIETELKELLKEEQITEEVIRDIEKREKEISDPKERRKIEKDRWKVEDDRKTLEGKRWELEQEKKDLSTELKKIEEEYQKISEKEIPLRERLKEINRLLKISPGEESLEKEEEKEEKKEEEKEEKEMITEDKKKLFKKLEEEKTTIELEKGAVTQVPTPKFGSEEQVEAEMAKKKEGRRKIAEEEMRKRIAEEEERRRKEKLLAEKRRLEENQIKITKEKPPFENSEVKEDKSSSSANELSPRESEGEKEARLFNFAAARVIKEETPETLIPKLPKKPSPIQKILIRALIFAILLSVIGFLYWFFMVKKVESQKIILPPEEKKEEERDKYPEIIIPASLISVNATETLEIMNSSEIPALLSQLLEKTFETEEHIRILFKNINENKVVGLKEFFEAFEVKTPEGLLEKLNNDFTLFIFSSGNKNHLGFVTKIENKENLLNSLFSWEATMEKDTEKLFEVLGKEGPALSSSFKTNFHQEISFRFLTISQEDFGICYAWFDDYFVFTSSFENIKKTIDLIKAGTLENQVGQMFIIGFEGKTVTPQLEEFFRKYKPGGILLLSKNIESAEQLKKLTKDLQNLSLRETGLPLFITVDQEGGIISRVDFLQEKTLQSEIEDPDEAYQIGLTRGQELKELGINLNLAPLLDITEETDFLFNRSFQKNAAETGNLAKSLIEGQKTANILTAVKHFPGYGGISFNPEETLAKTETLPEIFQFKKAIEANPEFIMTANMVYKNLDPNLLFTFSPTAIQFLKDNLGSEIIIISDDLAQKYLLANFSLKDIIIKPVQAGVNLLIFSGRAISVSEGLDVFFDTFKKGGFSQAKIKEAISKIIKIKEKLM